MDTDDLRSHLRKLHDELSAVHRVDPQSRHLLGEIMRDIARLIEEPAAIAASPPDRSLPVRLEKIAVKFEIDHPTLASSARGFIDLLGKAGL